MKSCKLGTNVASLRELRADGSNGLPTQAADRWGWHISAKENAVMNILLAIDSSPSSEAIITEVVVRPWPAQTKFCVLHVLDLFMLLQGASTASSLSVAELQDSEVLVKSVADRLA